MTRERGFHLGPGAPEFLAIPFGGTALLGVRE